MAPILPHRARFTHRFSAADLRKEVCRYIVELARQ
jgi:hypothetical protein